MEQNFPDQTENPRGFGGTEDPQSENEDGSVNATEQEQMQYDMLTIRARKMMFGKAKDNILEMLGSSESPAKAIGQAGAMLMKSLLQASKQKGMHIANDVAIEAGTEIADDLNELGKSAGVFKYDDQESENAEMEDAMLWGVKYFGEGMVADGEITPEMMQSAQEQVAAGIESEGGPKAPARKPNPIGDAVSQASQPAPQAAPPQGGLVGGQMPPTGGV